MFVAPLGLLKNTLFVDLRLNLYDSFYIEGMYAKKALKREQLPNVAQNRYDKWMTQARFEVTNTVKRLMEGKTTAKVRKPL